MLSPAEMKGALEETANECRLLWDENKDLQGRFVNDLAELQRIQMAISQLEHEQRHEQLQHVSFFKHISGADNELSQRSTIPLTII